MHTEEFIDWIRDICLLDAAEAREKAASLLGVSPATLHQWLDGETSPGRPVLLLMNAIREADNLELASRARRFAEQAHKGQYRKASGAPYFSHVCQVAQLVSEATSDPRLVAAAYLHDTIEDTGTSYSRLAELFGSSIANIVYALTNDKSVEKKNKADYLASKMAGMPPDILLIKLCDILANVSDSPSPGQLARYKRIIQKVTVSLPANPLAVWTEDHKSLAGRILAAISHAEGMAEDCDSGYR